MTNWFTADYHLGHANIIQYCERPFKSLEEMETTIIRNHNSRVKPDDTIYFLGDFCFKNGPKEKEGEGTTKKAEHYLKQLNGRFVFVKGNHDNNNSTKSIIQKITAQIAGQEVTLIHDPSNADTKEKVILHGHVHKLWKIKRNDTNKKQTLINVGCDVWGYKPINIMEIMREITKYNQNEGKQ